MSALFAIFSRVPLVWWLVGVLALGMGYTKYELMSLQTEVSIAETARAKALVAAGETARAKEKLAGENNAKIYEKLAAAKTARDSAQRDSAQRLRQLAEAVRARDATAAACSRYEGPTIGVIRDEVRTDFEQFAASADEVADNLRACQAYITNVVKPGDGKGQ